MDLRPTSYSWFGIMTSVVVWNVVFKPGDQFGTFRSRPDQAHFAFKNIPKLWHFINVPFAHKSSNPQPSRIILGGPTNLPILLRIQPHTADFNDIKRLAVSAGSPLP